ncbi:Hsp20/alpha crystallin family protein [Metabacillus sediminilitoris]|uniref:Hsp20/alpha crystallin family protein n=1 Tax=Metabacillus sediminilitoris TaxID=2567941 RepID=A0A4S4BSX1_9BACI|nr:Hsp20/alpha crystallin family protein [Metabacillus sediminilitoris]QGQ44155.1 Hsp20 family protein [Metabacillus sediminilitoris]THF78119.1 Hsp20/alpha crystallin family protein [Metabacillus sediminilitoris]
MSDPMKMMNDFFQNRPKRTLLDSIDNVFRKTHDANFSTEVVETDHHFKIIAELPGVPKEYINVEIRGEDVLIEVKKQKNLTRKLGGIRTITLPNYVIKRTMKAVYRDGMLEIRLDKKKPTRIEIE